MLQFCLSLSRQSKPSILTVGLFPKLALTRPPFLEDVDGDNWPDGEAIGVKGMNFSSLNRASWIKGLATLLGGDPHKNGGDEANCVNDWSTLQPPCFINNHMIINKSLQNLNDDEENQRRTEEVVPSSGGSQGDPVQLPCRLAQLGDWKISSRRISTW